MAKTKVGNVDLFIFYWDEFKKKLVMYKFKSVCVALLKIRHLFLGHQSVNVLGEEIHNVSF